MKPYSLVGILLLITAIVVISGCVNHPADPNTSAHIAVSEQNFPLLVEITGTGNHRSDAVHLSGIVNILAEVSGNGPFILSILDENGNQNLLLTEPGPFTTQYPQYLLTSLEITSGNYTPDIVSPNSWNLSIASGRKAYYSINGSMSTTSSGSQTIPLSHLSDGLTVIKGYSVTPGKITANLTVNGTIFRQLNTDPSGLIGFQAAYPLSSADTAFVDIFSDGEWMIEVTQPLPVSPPSFEKISGTANYVSSFYRFDDVINQELAFSNMGNSPVTAVVYAADGSVLASIVIPAQTDAYHHRFFQTRNHVIAFTALIEIIADTDDEWLVERCDYRAYFDPLSSEELRAIPRGTILSIHNEELAEFSVFKRFSETGFTAQYLPASDSEMRKIRAKNYTTIEFAGKYYALSFSG